MRGMLIYDYSLSLALLVFPLKRTLVHHKGNNLSERYYRFIPITIVVQYKFLKIVVNSSHWVSLKLSEEEPGL